MPERWAHHRSAGPAFVAAGASGILVALACAPYGLAALAWIALVPLRVALAGCELPRAFALGLLAGVMQRALSLDWLGAGLLAAGVPGFRGSVVHGVALVWVALPMAMFAAVAAGRVRGVVWVPAAWVVVEWLASLTDLGFPWIALGHSQSRQLGIAQLAAVTGVTGVSGALLLVNELFARALLFRTRGAIAASLALIVALECWGQCRLASLPVDAQGERVTVGIVHTAIEGVDPADLSWRGRGAAAVMDASLVARDAGAKLLVWPESVVPVDPSGSEPGAAELRSAVRATGLPVIFSALVVDRTSESPRLVNRVFAMSADGEVIGTRDKARLVPFGEFLPLRWLLGWWIPPRLAPGDVMVGEIGSPVTVAGISIGPLVCYEAVLPAPARCFAAAGARVLVQLTNEATLVGTSAALQHFAQGTMRAIETGLPIVRVANYGVSAVIDPVGRVRWQALPGYSTSEAVEVPLALASRTPFVRLGDWFPVACLGVLLLGWTRRTGGRQSSRSPVAEAPDARPQRGSHHCASASSNASNGSIRAGASPATVRRTNHRPASRR